MNRAQLEERKVLYEIKLQEIDATSYEAEIEEELAKERARIEAKYAAQKQRDIDKVHHYLELLSELIFEAAKEEVTVKREIENSDARVIVSTVEN